MLAGLATLSMLPPALPAPGPEATGPYSHTSAPTEPHTLLPTAPGSAQAQAQAQDTRPVGTAQPTHRPAQGSPASRQTSLIVHKQPRSTGRDPRRPRPPFLVPQEAEWRQAGRGVGQARTLERHRYQGQAPLTTLWPSERGGLRTAWPCSGSALLRHLHSWNHHLLGDLAEAGGQGGVPVRPPAT